MQFPRTAGLSPKLTAPLAATLSAFAYTSIEAGKVDRTSVALLAVAAINAAAAYMAPAGNTISAPAHS